MQAFVGFLQFHVLADDGDGHAALRVFDVVDKLLPRLQLGVAGGKAQHDGDLLVQPFLIELEGQLVDVAHVDRREDGVLVHVAEEGDFAPQIGGDGFFAAAENDVGLDADGAQFLDAVLGGLGIVFARRTQIGHERQVNVEAVVPPEFRAHLPDGFEEGQALDVAHGAADFDDGDVRSRVFGLVRGEAQDGTLDFVSDVGDNLHGAAQVVTVPFLGDDLVVDGAGGGVVLLGKGGVQEAFVMAEIEVGFRAVVRDVHLTMLVGVHRAGVDVDIGIKLLDGHGQAARFQQRADGCRRKALAEGGKDATGDEDKLGLHEKPRVMIFPASQPERRTTDSP